MYGSSVPKSLSVDPTYGWPPAIESSVPDATPSHVKSGTAAGQKDMNFGDLIDVINPLQHIPIVSSIYRAITSDEISTGARIVGDTIFGGIYGFASALLNTVTEAVTGKDIGGNLVALVTGDDAGKESGPAGDEAPPSQVATARPWIDPDKKQAAQASPAAGVAKPWIDPDKKQMARATPAAATAKPWVDPDKGLVAQAAPAASTHSATLTAARFFPIGSARGGGVFINAAATASAPVRTEHATAAGPRPGDPFWRLPPGVLPGHGFNTPAAATTTPLPGAPQRPGAEAAQAAAPAAPTRPTGQADASHAQASYTRAMELSRQLQQFYQPTMQP